MPKRSNRAGGWFFAGLMLVFGGAGAEDVPVNPNIAGRENIEWSISYAYHLTDNQKERPRVLLVGDSICNYYKDNAISFIDTRMNVTYWVSSFCLTNPSYLPSLEVHLRQSRYDVIHFNNGLHSLDTDTAAWTNGLVQAVKTIRRLQPQARLVWCTSTPLTEAAKTAKAQELNAAARTVFARSDMGATYTDDLFSLLDPLDRGAYWLDVFHHKPAAVTMEAERVTASVIHANAFPPCAGQVQYQPFITTSDACVWKGVRLDDLTDFSCTLWGASMTPAGGTGFCTSNDGATADVQFRFFNAGTLWCVKVRFTQQGEDVWAKAIYAKYALNQPSIDFDFDVGGNVVPVATGRTVNGYGASVITARRKSASRGLVVRLADAK